MDDNTNKKVLTEEDRMELQWLIQNFMRSKGIHNSQAQVLEIEPELIDDHFFSRHQFTAHTLSFVLTMAFQISFYYAIWLHHLPAMVLSFSILLLWRMNRDHLLRLRAII